MAAEEDNELRQCTDCGDPTSGIEDGIPLCSACGDERELHVGRDTLDEIAAVISTTDSPVEALRLVKELVRGTGREVD